MWTSERLKKIAVITGFVSTILSGLGTAVWQAHEWTYDSGKTKGFLECKEQVDTEHAKEIDELQDKIKKLKKRLRKLTPDTPDK